MNKTLLAALNDAERLLVAETEPAKLNSLTEDEVADLHDRIRRARNKYVGQYRRGGARRVSQAGGRGAARPKNRSAALKAEAFEEALSRVSRRLGTLAHQAAVELKNERIAAARGEKPAKKAAASTAPAKRATSRSATSKPAKQSTRSPRTEKNRATTGAQGARRQAKRDSR